MKETKSRGYDCWLGYERIADKALLDEYKKWCAHVVAFENTTVIHSAWEEMYGGIKGLLGIRPRISNKPESPCFVILGTLGKTPLIDEAVGNEEKESLKEEGYLLKTIDDGEKSCIIIAGKTEKGVLYGVYNLLGRMQAGQSLGRLNTVENPRNSLRMVNQWDNMDGSIERGYAGRSILYSDNKMSRNIRRIGDYARLLSSVGINGIVLNNVNVKQVETRLITRDYLPQVANLADIFRSYGIKIYLSINFASPIHSGGLPTADPLDPAVREWWRKKAEEIYSHIGDFGGFLVKADSEFNPGPYKYGRTHADGANMLAEALEPFGGLVIWRCFVYNCLQDWRDRTTDRAKAACDNFKPLDGNFHENVVLQVKNGPMDFQVREPVSPMLGAMESTNQNIELQITQEYTGQQVHLCYLVPQWKAVLDFDTHAKGEGSTVKRIADGSLFQRKHCGFAGVSNIGNDTNWTGHPLAQANLYGFGRLAWNPDLPAEEIAGEWIQRTFGNEQTVIDTVKEMLMSSWGIYENYTSPLGIGWMINPNYHYGPNVDGYEYSKWGTYHRADCSGMGVDRTVKSGTGYTAQYYSPNRERYESMDTCPEELLLFFHHVAYTHVLKSGKTVIQHIYDTHFEGAEQAEALKEKWAGLKDFIRDERFESVLKRLEEQAEHSKEWRDVINTYFYRKSGIGDAHGRKIF